MRGRTPARARIATLCVWLVVAPAAASPQDRTRVDIYGPGGQRQGYAIIDRDSGRVDLYDRGSRRAGYGRIEPDGRLELFDSRGKRQNTIVPSPPSQNRTR